MNIVHSLLTVFEIVALYELIKAYRREGMKIVEIGSAEGGTAFFMSRYASLSGGRVYAIDIWEDEAVYKAFLSYGKSLIDNEIVFPIRLPSIKAAELFENESLDIVFIDADHRYKAVAEDIKTWLPKIRVGGIICGHDCERHYSDYSDEQQREIDRASEKDDANFDCHAGVIKALNDIWGNEFLIEEGTTIWFKEKNA